ncbi:hypothetical protein CRG98_040952 [Punica granatum]|uniref:Uncharacterized protein n=1 Tax=Punica granatum TaxID=22663 RepID=A0A2I0I5H2_PUNGR|nr:hypothetical protein CRG98_040952 [Punica granatum]
MQPVQFDSLHTIKSSLILLRFDQGREETLSNSLELTRFGQPHSSPLSRPKPARFHGDRLLTQPELQKNDIPRCFRPPESVGGGGSVEEPATYEPPPATTRGPLRVVGNPETFQNSHCTTNSSKTSKTHSRVHSMVGNLRSSP